MFLIDFLRHGDSNSKWFHTRASARRIAHHITTFLDEKGQEKIELEDIDNIIVRFLQDLFTTSAPSDIDSILQHVQLRVSLSSNNSLTTPYSADEIKKAIFQMHPSKASGLDGLNPFFYQFYWNIEGDDVIRHTGHSE